MATYTFYVHYGDGNDSTGDGSAGNPYKTITKACAEAGSNRYDDCYIYLQAGQTYYINEGYDYIPGSPEIFTGLTFERAGHLHIEGLPDTNGVYPRIVVDFKLFTGNFFLQISTGVSTIRGYLTLKRLVFVCKCRYDPNNPLLLNQSKEFIRTWSHDITVEQCVFLSVTRPYQTWGWYTGPALKSHALADDSGKFGHAKISNCQFEKFSRGLYLYNHNPMYVKGNIFKDISEEAIEVYAYVPQRNFHTIDYSYNDFYNVTTQFTSVLQAGNITAVGNTAADPKLYSSEGVRVNGLYPTLKELWTAGVGVNNLGRNNIAESSLHFDYSIGDCGNTVYVELNDNYTTIDVDANTCDQLMIGAVVQMVSGDDNNNPFIQYKVGSTWYTKVLSQNLFYVYDSALDIYAEPLVYALIDMSGEGDWTGTVVGVRFGGWNTAKVGQAAREARLGFIIPMEYDDVPDGGQDKINPTSPCIDKGDPNLYDSYVAGGGGLLGRGTSRSDQGAYGGGQSAPYGSISTVRYGRAVGEPESNTREGYATTEGLLVNERTGRCVATETTITTVGFTSITERLLSAGDMRKAITGQTLQRVACDATILEFDNEDQLLYDPAERTGLLYPKIFEGTLTEVAGDIMRDSSQDFTGFTLIGLCEMISGKATGNRYYIIYNNINSWTVLPDPDDSNSTDPETDGVKVGDLYKIDCAYDIWAQITVGFQYVPEDRILWFGGFLSQKDVQQNPANRSVVCRSLGFEKLLESYDGYNVSKVQGQLYFLSGVSIISWTPSPDTPIKYGPRALHFTWASERIEGVEIDSVQANNSPGLKTLEFKPPYHFKYNGGPWASRATQQTEYLYDAGGNTITCKFGGRYPETAQEMFFIVKDPFRPYVAKEGIPSLQLGEGPVIGLRRTFLGVYRYAGGSYTDITETTTYGRRILTDGDYYVSIFSGRETLYLCSVEPFTGFEIEIEDTSNFDGYVFIEYSQGLDQWHWFSGQIDGTDHFAQNGRVTWTMPRDWVKTTIYPGVAVKGVYVVKVTVFRSTSGSCKLIRINRTHRIYDKDGLGVDVQVFHDVLPLEDKSDQVIVKKNGVIGAWYNMIDFHTLAERAADAFGFPSGCRNTEELKYTWDDARIGVWGRLPYLEGEEKAPEAVAWDDANSILYTGYDNELWKIPEKGDAEKVCEIPPFDYFKLNIRRLAITHSGALIHGVAWKPYDDTEFKETDYDDATYDGTEDRPTAGCIFQYNTVTGVLKYWMLRQVGDSSYGRLLTGEVCYRKGRHWTDNLGGGSDYDFTAIGQNPETAPWASCGENICAPVPGVFRVCQAANGQNVACSRGALFGTKGSIPNTVNQDWFFSWMPKSETGGTRGKFYNGPVGYHFIQDNLADFDEHYCHFRWPMGQDGYVVWNPTTQGWRFLTFWGSEYAVKEYGYDSGGTVWSNTIWSCGTPTVFDRDNLLCGCFDPDNAAVFGYAGWITWDDIDTNISKAYIAYIRDEDDYDPYTQQFKFESMVSQIGSSIYGSEPYCMPLSMAFDPDKGCIHGCLLNRNDMTYHYFVLLYGLELYTREIGTNQNYQIKAFAWNPSDNKMYSALCDVRFHQVGARILRVTFDPTRDTPIEYEFLGTVDDNEWDMVTMITTEDGVFGITGPSKGWIFQINTSFYPRMLQANLTDMNGRVLFEHLCSPFGFRMRVHEDNRLMLKELNL